jgi:hypothetical protein
MEIAASEANEDLPLTEPYPLALERRENLHNARLMRVI